MKMDDLGRKLSKNLRNGEKYVEKVKKEEEI